MRPPGSCRPPRRPLHAPPLIAMMRRPGHTDNSRARPHQAQLPTLTNDCLVERLAYLYRPCHTTHPDAGRVTGDSQLWKRAAGMVKMKKNFGAIFTPEWSGQT
jgi:hypothetical protein